MTEQEWSDSRHPMPMLEFLQDRVSDRQLRLFALACCRHHAVWRLLREQSRALVEAAARVEEFGEGWQPLLDAARLAPQGRASGGSWRSTNPVRLPPSSQAERAVLALAMTDAWDAAWEVTRQAQNLLGSEACDVLREIVAHPLRSYPPAESMPAMVVQLADALQRGQDCAFALHDALLDAGHADLAQHFRKQKQHLKGCWALDLVLGKE